jgi:hypothetical protein
MSTCISRIVRWVLCCFTKCWIFYSRAYDLIMLDIERWIIDNPSSFLKKYFWITIFRWQLKELINEWIWFVEIWFHYRSMLAKKWNKKRRNEKSLDSWLLLSFLLACCLHITIHHFLSTDHEEANLVLRKIAVRRLSVWWRYMSDLSTDKPFKISQNAQNVCRYKTTRCYTFYWKSIVWRPRCSRK